MILFTLREKNCWLQRNPFKQYCWKRVIVRSTATTVWHQTKIKLHRTELWRISCMLLSGKPRMLQYVWSRSSNIHKLTRLFELNKAHLVKSVEEWDALRTLSGRPFKLSSRIVDIFAILFSVFYFTRKTIIKDYETVRFKALLKSWRSFKSLSAHISLQRKHYHPWNRRDAASQNRRSWFTLHFILRATDT